MSEEQKNPFSLSDKDGKKDTNPITEEVTIKEVSDTEAIPVSNSNDFSNFKVNKKGFIEVNGVIEETLPSITFRVKLENDQEILARLSGRMRLNRIMLLPGDKVKVEISPYDLKKGRITYRY